MWQNDTVYLQTSVDTNVMGSTKRVWTQSTAVTCDVQDISKEYVHKEYGLTDSTNYKQIFDHSHASWVKGSQVKFNNLQWMVRHVEADNDKMGLSNHVYIIISEVI